MTIRIVRDTVTPGLMRLLSDLDDPRPMLKRVGAYGVGVAQLAFDREEDPATGQRWKRLSDAYKAWKTRKGFSSQILQLSGKLKNSSHYKVTGRRKVRWGFQDEKVVYHMSTRPRRKMPLRTALGIGSEDYDEIHAIAMRFLAGEQ